MKCERFHRFWGLWGIYINPAITAGREMQTPTVGRATMGSVKLLRDTAKEWSATSGHEGASTEREEKREKFKYLYCVAFLIDSKIIINNNSIYWMFTPCHPKPISEIDTVMVRILQLRKLRPREVKPQARGHQTGMRKNRVWAQANACCPLAAAP